TLGAIYTPLSTTTSPRRYRRYKSNRYSRL
ncbi:hypothetical protein CKAH01_18919, partial [Colletotrichum kahawae]